MIKPWMAMTMDYQMLKTMAAHHRQDLVTKWIAMDKMIKSTTTTLDHLMGNKIWLWFKEALVLIIVYCKEVLSPLPVVN